MPQVIIHDNGAGGVAVCIPTGDLPIDEVLKKDCPAGSIIVDDSSLPSGSDSEFFNAWELQGSSVVVSIDKAKNEQLKSLNRKAKNESAHRQMNTLSGINNNLSDSAWIELLANARTAISSANSTSDLISAVEPVDAAIAANAG